jgi:arylsulfate sulfotransferase
MVEFGPDTSYARSTAGYPIMAGYRKITILVAGMRASTLYHMRVQVQCAESTLASEDMTFTTGPLPSTPIPAIQVRRPNPVPGTSENPGIELIDITTMNSLLGTLFTDRDGNPIWYYYGGSGTYAFPFKLLPNGHVILNIVSATDSTLREVDLAGNTIREMDIFTLQQKLQSAGYNLEPIDFHHDMLPLDNGHLLALVQVSKNFTDLAGYPGTLAVIGDAVVDLDQNLNPVWVWNSFDHLDVNRHLNGLPDWTHSNALVYSPSDGNLIVSMRHQSWVLKIDYNNGAGSGNVLWRLGYQGDFALTQNGAPTSDPSQWFSFQHFPSIVSQSGPQTKLTIWDNGDNRVLNTSGEICSDPVLGNPAFPSCYSRATVFQIDESAMVADLTWDTPLPDYGRWGGSINQLASGNIEFDMNAPAIAPSVGAVGSEIREVTQGPTPAIVWQMDITPVVNTAYRAYRVPSLYPGVTWQY